MSKKYSFFANALKDAFITSFFSLIILGPILCFVIQAYTVNVEYDRALWLIAFTFSGKLIYILLKENRFIRKIFASINRFFNTKTMIDKLQPAHHAWLWMLAGSGLIFPFIVGKYWLSVAILCLIYILLGLGLNIIVGLAGLLNLGFVAFYAIGAYSYALGALYLNMGFWLAIPFSALMAGLFGALLGFPVLRMYGDYLAIVTLGFGEIIRLILNNWASLTNGPNGIEIKSPSIFNLTFSSQADKNLTPFHEYFGLNYDSSYRYIFLYLVIFFIICLTLRFVVRLQHMPLGRTFEALREDEIACRSLGINHVTTKLMALSLGAMIAGIGGVFYASLEGFVDPASFTFVESALILSIVVLGGMGSTLGVVIAAIILTLLPEFLREFSEYRMLIYGALLVLMMIWRPQGLIKFKRQPFVKIK
ncbi:MAG: high-affinity branched-chain amino acid ABC transporter permease LivM [Gammaproteobacteria bacterium]|jgi:branched-chain amino acid transport system permease protein|nr:high-affinity branched-chain amino acid ABC transporter permease LivM [Gammaproteobacteria bacterium]